MPFSKKDLHLKGERLTEDTLTGQGAGKNGYIEVLERLTSYEEPLSRIYSIRITDKLAEFVYGTKALREHLSGKRVPTQVVLVEALVLYKAVIEGADYETLLELASVIRRRAREKIKAVNLHDEVKREVVQILRFYEFSTMEEVPALIPGRRRWEKRGYYSWCRGCG
ncbi:hypothetical protein P8X24_10940 [Pyrococcus kukulkanii]|uniref:hypothetical protein n=1 Tax=Pyrococcus kukulkanii TaxID=1609559 RepID=UPI003565CD0D